MTIDYIVRIELEDNVSIGDTADEIKEELELSGFSVISITETPEPEIETK